MRNPDTKANTALLALTTPLLLLATALGVAGCSSGSSKGGVLGSRGVAAAPITSSQNIGPMTGLEVQPATSLTVDNAIGGGFQIAVDGMHTAGTADYTRDAEYVVESPGVATISGDGFITPVSEGQTNIAVRYAGMATTVSVTVVAPGVAPPTLMQLDIHPAFRNLSAVNPQLGIEQYQQLVVYATDDTGRLWDLTRTAPIGIFDTSNAPSLAARVSQTGLLRGIVNDEVIAVSRVASAALLAGSNFVLGLGPDATPVDTTSLYNGGTLAGSSNPIDVAVLNGLFGQLVEPSAAADDGEFLRRLYSDALGRTPTVTELTAFEQNASVTKRNAEITRVLSDPAFATKWGSLFAEWFEMRRGANADAFEAWARTQINAGTPIATMVAALTSGNVASFETEHDDTAQRIDILLMAGTGMSAECAVCHDHPMTGPTDTLKWTQLERYGLDAFLATDNAWATPLDKNGVRSGNNGQPVQPAFALDPTANVGSTLATPLQQRRDELAGLLTTSAAFNRGMAHRIFAETNGELLNANQFLEKNVGAVLAPEVLTALTTTFAADSSLRGFLTQIFSSQYYQLSSAYADENSDGLLPRRVLRRHNAETLDAAVAEVTGSGIGGGDLTFFRQTFGFPFDRDAISERVGAVNMSQSFLLMNSPVVQDRVANGGKIGALAAQVNGNQITASQAVQQIWRSALSRNADGAELACALTTINDAPNMTEGLEDVAAVVMSTAEFVMR